MNKRSFVLAPLAAVALFAFALPASAQSVGEDIAQLKQEVLDPEFRAELGHARQAVMSCQTPENNEALQARITDEFLRADALFSQAETKSDRLQAHILESMSEQNLGFLVPPDWCYS